MSRPRSLLYGVGKNDADYKVNQKIDGKQVWCPFYKTWKEMLRRCFCKKTQIYDQSYVGVRVCNEWLVFSNFKSWMIQQNWNGKHLDKDLLSDGERIYSPDTCVFISKELNLALSGEMNPNRELPTGVVFDKGVSKYRTSFKNKYTQKTEYLGVYENLLDASNAWKKRKYEYVKFLAEQETDFRVKEAVELRYI